MVTPNDPRVGAIAFQDFAGPIDNFIGIGAVPYKIAEAENPVVASFGVFQDGGERFMVGVDVAENQMTHLNCLYRRHRCRFFWGFVNGRQPDHGEFRRGAEPRRDADSPQTARDIDMFAALRVKA